MASNAQRVFVAGNGAAPPALTGRASEQAVLSRCLADLRSNSAPPHDVVLVGPRGNGKTVLLRWFEHACAQNEPAVDVAWLTPSAVPNQPALLDALAPRRRLAKLLPRKRPNAGTSRPRLLAQARLLQGNCRPARSARTTAVPWKAGIASVGSAEWASPNGRGNGRGGLAEAVASRCRRRPLAVLLDEAHTLALDVGTALLNGSQEVRGARAPFLLVLAGTPGLPTHLDAMNASFWSRLGEGELGIGRLSEKAAKQALAEPLEAHDVDIDADALAHDADTLVRVVAQSQRYPYFIQLWGDALWQRHLASGATAIAREDADAVQPTVAARVANYHQRRFAELESEGLVPVAAAVARLFVEGDADTASNQDVDAALVTSGIDDAGERYAKREALNRLGYVWRPPYQQAPFRWHAGIPSLMPHVLKEAA